MGQKATTSVVFAAFALAVAAGALPAAASASTPTTSTCLGSAVELVDDRIAFAGSQPVAATVVDREGNVVAERAGPAGNWAPFAPREPGTYRVQLSDGERIVAAVDRVVVPCEEGAAPVLNDGGRPLLSLSNARPGDSDEACVLVTHAGTQPANVRFSGTATGSGLERFLHLRIVRGTLARLSAASCESFVAAESDAAGADGALVYDGTLAAFAGASLGSERWAPGESHAYRVVVSVADDQAAQTLGARLTLRWTAETAGGDGQDTPAGTGAAAPVETDASRNPTPPGATASPGALDAPSPVDALRGAADDARTLVEKIAHIAEEAAKRSAFPMALLGLVAAFLAIQGRIDRRDPKLALAPAYADPDLAFVDYPTTENLDG